MAPAKICANSTANGGAILVYSSKWGMLIWPMTATLAKRSALQLAPEA